MSMMLAGEDSHGQSGKDMQAEAVCYLWRAKCYGRRKYRRSVGPKCLFPGVLLKIQTSGPGDPWARMYILQTA